MKHSDTNNSPHAPLHPQVLRVGASAALSISARAESQSIELCAPVRRLVTIHSGSLRELLFSLPALRTLRETFDGAHLTAVVREGLAPLLLSCPLVDEVLMRPEGGLSSHAPLMAKLHARHCDVAIAFSTSRNGILLALASGAHVRLGFDGAKMDALLTHRVARELIAEQESTPFAIEDYLDITRALGCAPRCHDYCDLIEPAVEAEREVAVWIDERGLGKSGAKAWIALFPQREAGGKKMTIDESAAWARAAHLLSQRAPVVLCGARSNRAILAAAREYSAAHENTKIFDAGGAFDLPATAALLRSARLFTGWCGGPMHLAAAVSTPVVALHSSDLKSDNGDNDDPRGVPHRLLKCGAAPEDIHRAALELIGL